MTAPPASAAELEVRGVVQGVGFRPFVHRLALRHGLGGWVRNESGTVRIVVEGPGADIDAFVRSVRAEAPPLARIDSLERLAREGEGIAGFRIVESALDPGGRLPVSPDVATCARCEEELFDPSDRRHRYPFITCTDCGPRFTVIEAMPYDRARTTMRRFDQCAACLREYGTPGDRRHHSETNACPECGPRVWFEVPEEGDAAGAVLPARPPAPAESGGAGRAAGDGSGRSARAAENGATAGRKEAAAGKHEAAAARAERIAGDGAIAAAAKVLASGGIVAIRGLGGFHLAVDATDEDAVARLRRRKRRDAKPLAVMVRTLEEARALAEVGPDEARWLESRERPVVLVRGCVADPCAAAGEASPTGEPFGAAAAPHGRSGHALAPSVAPGLDTVGVMLAYTPLHRLLLDAVDRPLVMTSGNASDEPICTGNDEARERLGPIADALLIHDREIVSRYDDSVLRVAGGATVMLRRSRGFAPLPLRLPAASPSALLAFGAHLKNTFTLVRGSGAYVSQHVGDLGTLETLEHFRGSLDRFRSLFGIEPQVAARDLHPAYLSTRLAEESGLERVIPVQHHHAHVAAVLAEHGRTKRALGLAFDGTGQGEDGRVWGAEALLADLEGFERVGRLRYAPLPGGERAVRRPWRTALGYLSLEPDRDPAFERAFRGVPEEELEVARRQAETGLNAPLASSVGRLFDAAAAVLGVRRVARYEGQAPMELEALAGRRAARPLPFPIVVGDVGRTDDAVGRVMDPVPLLAALGEAAAAGRDPADLAAAFHESVAATAAALAEEVCEERGVRTVVLGGGCFQNARLLVSVKERLEAAGLEVLTALELPPGDGGISYGQAAVAAARLAAEEAGGQTGRGGAP